MFVDSLDGSNIGKKTLDAGFLSYCRGRADLNRMLKTDWTKPLIMHTAAAFILQFGFWNIDLIRDQYLIITVAKALMSARYNIILESMKPA